MGYFTYPPATGSTGNVKTDGSAPLTANWNAGAFSGTFNSVAVGSAANTISALSTIVNTGTLTLPTSTDTLVGRATTDTLTNKTLTAPVIATISNSGTITVPTGTDTLVGKATTDTLTNKTISASSNTISNIADANISGSAAIAYSKLNLATSVAAADLAGNVSSPDNLLNVGLAASVGSNLLTVALKQKDGSTNAAAGTGTVSIAFRDSTLANGQYFQRTVTGALSISTVATGATLGLVSAQNQYIYVYAIDNAGTVELALAGSSSFEEGTRYSTTIINGSSTDALTLYSTTARSNVAIRLIGRLKSNQSTSGTYAAAPTEIALMPLANNLKPRSEACVLTGNGHGSTNTKIRRFTTTERAFGTAITYADSAANGGSFTINEDGIYAISYNDNFTAAAQIGVSVNSAQLTTNIWSITAANIVAASATGAANFPCHIGATLFLQVGDVIRAHDEGANSGTGPAAKFRITQMVKY